MYGISSDVHGAGLGLSSHFVSCAAAESSSLEEEDDILTGDDHHSSDDNGGDSDGGGEEEGEEEGNVPNESNQRGDHIMNTNNNSHIAKSRFMPFEDVAVGLLAERCHITPNMIPDPDSFRMYRGSGRKQERDRINSSAAKGDRDELRLPTYDWSVSVVLQHRIGSN